ncbi:RNA polymerase sigma factor [Anaerolentibacter hominis]|uniref:RNA polymerase sigma factor n=1 Tax=Anaerolentibacter hominis TaxID=3079009 RepID=UPI0031B8152A
MKPDQSLRTDDCTELVNEYASMVYKLAFAQTRNRQDADDIFQEVFLRYVRKRPAFESKEHEKAWFIRVTINCCKNLWGSAFRRRTQSLTCDLLSETGQPEQILEEYLIRLPRNYLAVIHLHYYEGLPVAEIGKIVKKSDAAVRMCLVRARKMIKEWMEGDGVHV